MNIPDQKTLDASPSSSMTPMLRRKRGIALVIVVSCLLLISGLVMSFFLSVTSETKSSRVAESGVRTKDLTDTATNIVMAQIRAATSGGSNIAWASQPGMIRTYGSSVVTGTPSPATTDRAYYKLYSAAKMTWVPGDGAFDPASEVPTDWMNQKSLFSDLNVPVTNLAGQLQYPILDPTSTAVGLSITSAPVSTANPAPMPVRWIYVLRDGTLTSPTSSTAASASTGTGASVSWNPSDPTAPTKDNPIVGRVAFWTDDDTNKININTAAGDTWVDSSATVPGSYWDVPRTWSPLDRTFAGKQLVNGEYQRYPGHPSTVYLSAVFPDLTREQIGAIVPRVKDEGSKGGTLSVGFPISADSDRLYATVDELLYKPDRAVQTGITQAQLEKSLFFLTASSRAPETTLFNTPRISMWPLNRNTTTAARTLFDRLIGFCSTIGGDDYYFTRDAITRSSTLPREHANNPWLDFYGGTGYGSNDSRVDASRNRALFDYLKAMTGRPVPGFSSSATFLSKYPEDRTQILAEVFDYIRSTNLFDDSLEPSTDRFTDAGKQFTARRTSETGTNPGHGQVTPIRIANDSAPNDRTQDNMGFGRFHTISEVAIQFICTADGSVDPNKANPTAIENYKIRSNRPDNRTLKNITTTDARGVPLAQTERNLEAIVYFELFSPGQGWTGLQGDINIRVKGLNSFTIAGAGQSAKSLGFPADANMRQTSGNVHDGRAWGGSNGFRFALNGRRLPARGLVPADKDYGVSSAYPFISLPVTINATGTSMQFGGGQIEIEIYADADASSANTLVQTIKIDVPEGTFPIPELVTSGTANTYGADSQGNLYYASPSTTPEYWWTLARNGVFFAGTEASTATDVDAAWGGTAGRLMGVGKAQGSNGAANARVGGFFRVEDVVRTLMPYHGDYRLIAANPYVYQDKNGKGVFQPHAAWNDLTVRLAHTLQVEATSNGLQRDLANNTASDTATPWKNQPSGKLVAKAQYGTSRFPDGPHVFSVAPTTGKPIMPGFASTNLPGNYGDWDTGVTVVPDGAYINKPDEGNDFRNGGAGVPYYDVNWTQQSGGVTLFSPNRQVPSAGMFGSLPTGVKAGHPWQTLLFRPDTTGTATNPNHPGGQTGFPKDHLLLDMFWMPVVEPYAISEPFSTAGKINMNYQIMPFTYIKRSTAMQALLRSERVTAIPLTAAPTYKNNSGTEIAETRQRINAEATLLQFQKRFDDGNLFRSASEICDIHLVPASVSVSSESAIFNAMQTFWSTNKLTGDNLRERPYTTLYPRLTTKSNTYTVHYRVQSLQQPSRRRGDSATAWATWEEDNDNLQSETRGSATIERYVDPSDPNLPDYATTLTTSSTDTLDSHYRFRVISTKKFAP